RAERREAEVRVALQAPERRVEDRECTPRRTLARVQRLVRKCAQEVLLTLDAPEIRARVVLPSSVHERLVVARSHVRERILTGEVLTSRGVDVEATERVLGGRGEGDGDRPDCVHDLAEPGEVDFEIVTDRDIEIPLDRLYEALRAGIECGVDLRVADSGDVDPQVAREGEEEAGS